MSKDSDGSYNPQIETTGIGAFGHGGLVNIAEPLFRVVGGTQ